MSLLIYPRQQDADTHEKNKMTLKKKKEQPHCLFGCTNMTALTAQQHGLTDKAKHFLTHKHTTQRERHTLHDFNVVLHFGCCIREEIQKQKSSITKIFLYGLHGG